METFPWSNRVLLLRTLADGSIGNSPQHDLFRAKWGRESTIMWGRARHAEFGPHPHTLSIRAVWGGTQLCHVSGRTIAVDDDNFLILNHGRVVSTSIRATHAVEALTICFAPELAGMVHEDAGLTLEQALERGGSAAAAAPEFLENLQRHENKVSPVLRFIRAHLCRGLSDDSWYEEQLVFLLERMRARQSELARQIEDLGMIRAATRREAFRRVGLATDYLQSHYAGNVDLDTLARMACLSKYHFLRVFTLIHGVTPRAYLQRKRVDVAVRLLQSTQLAVSEVAANVGFAYESTLLRHVRRRLKLSPRQLRSRAPTSLRDAGRVSAIAAS